MNKKNLHGCFYYRNDTHVFNVKRHQRTLPGISAIVQLLLFLHFEADNIKLYVICALISMSAIAIFSSFIDTSLKSTMIFSNVLVSVFSFAFIEQNWFILISKSQTSDNMNTAFLLESLVLGFWAVTLVLFASVIGQHFSNNFDQPTQLVFTSNENPANTSHNHDEYTVHNGY